MQSAANANPKVDTMCLCLCLFLCLCLRVSLAWAQGHGQAQADTGPQALPDQQRSCPCLPLVISWFPSSTFLICLFEPWRRLPCANLASPGQNRRIRVGLPTPNVSQKMSRTALSQCSPPSINSSHLRAHIATTASTNRYTDATSFFLTGPATGGIGTVPAFWERSDPDSNGISGPVPACWERPYYICWGKR